jgi:signal peptidase I
MSSSGAGRGGAAAKGNKLSGIAVALGCVLFLGAFAWGAVLYQPYVVPTTSMEPSVGAGDRVLAQRISGDEVRRGDIVVFKDQAWGDLPMVKRVIGVGGDTVECCDPKGRLSVNGTAFDEPYVSAAERVGGQDFRTTVPKGELFLLGDHRGDSIDSRDRLTEQGGGAVPRDAVQGRVDATAWPPGNVGTVARPDTFAELPGGVSEPGPVRAVTFTLIAGAVLILVGAAYGPVAARIGRSGARV